MRRTTLRDISLHEVQVERVPTQWEQVIIGLRQKQRISTLFSAGHRERHSLFVRNYRDRASFRNLGEHGCGVPLTTEFGRDAGMSSKCALRWSEKCLPPLKRCPQLILSRVEPNINKYAMGIRDTKLCPKVKPNLEPQRITILWARHQTQLKYSNFKHRTKPESLCLFPLDRFR